MDTPTEKELWQRLEDSQAVIDGWAKLIDGWAKQCEALRAQESTVLGLLTDAGVNGTDPVAGVKELIAKLAAAAADANKATEMMVTMAGERDALKAKLAAAEGNPDRDYAWDEMRQQRDAALERAFEYEQDAIQFRRRVRELEAECSDSNADCNFHEARVKELEAKLAAALRALAEWEAQKK